MNKSLTIEDAAIGAVEVLKDTVAAASPDYIADERTTDELIEEINKLKDKVNKRLCYRVYRDIGM